MTRIMGWVLLSVVAWLPIVAVSIRLQPSERGAVEWSCSSLDGNVMSHEETMAADGLTYHLWRIMDEEERTKIGSEVNLDARVKLEPSGSAPTFATVVLKVRDMGDRKLGCIRQQSGSVPFDWSKAAEAALVGVRQLIADWPMKDET